MIDIQKQITYWSNSGMEDMDVAHDLIYKNSHTVHGLFFAHLALEKLLKALVCKETNDIPHKLFQSHLQKKQKNITRKLRGS